MHKIDKKKCEMPPLASPWDCGRIVLGRVKWFEKKGLIESLNPAKISIADNRKFYLENDDFNYPSSKGIGATFQGGMFF